MSQPMVLEQPSDAELMARVRRGDQDAFTDLVERHKDAVVSYVARLTADRDRAVMSHRLGHDPADRQNAGLRRIDHRGELVDVEHA